MILIDEAMPDSCFDCFAAGCYGCNLTEQLLAKSSRLADCPLIEVEEKRIRERVSHVDWQDRTVYVRKEENHDR